MKVTERILKIPAYVMRIFAEGASRLIDDDAKNGIMQNGNTYGYKSKTYMKYKANDMRRFTNNKSNNKSKTKKEKQSVNSQVGTNDKQKPTSNKSKNKSNNKSKVKKKKQSVNPRLKAYKGLTIESNETSFVNMTVTGRALKGLHVSSATTNNAVLSYKQRDVMKVIGNKNRGYDILDIRTENMEKLKELVIDPYLTGGGKMIKNINLGINPQIDNIID